MSDHPHQKNHPYGVGALVRHVNQEFPPLDIPTAVVHAVVGPYHDGTYEYQVTTGREFSRHLSADNPLCRRPWWGSNAVRLIDDGTAPETTQE